MRYDENQKKILLNKKDLKRLKQILGLAALSGLLAWAASCGAKQMEDNNAGYDHNGNIIYYDDEGNIIGGKDIFTKIKSPNY